MNAATKAELASANETLRAHLAVAEAESKRLADINEQWRKGAEIHPEASALSKCMKALDTVAPDYARPLASSFGSSSSKPQQDAVRRILVHLATRYGVTL